MAQVCEGIEVDAVDDYRLDSLWIAGAVRDRGELIMHVC
jgi:hypothetical protein